MAAFLATDASADVGLAQMERFEHLLRQLDRLSEIFLLKLAVQIAMDDAEHIRLADLQLGVLADSADDFAAIDDFDRLAEPAVDPRRRVACRSRQRAVRLTESDGRYERRARHVDQRVVLLDRDLGRVADAAECSFVVVVRARGGRADRRGVVVGDQVAFSVRQRRHLNRTATTASQSVGRHPDCCSLFWRHLVQVRKRDLARRVTWAMRWLRRHRIAHDRRRIDDRWARHRVGGELTG